MISAITINTNSNPFKPTITATDSGIVVPYPLQSVCDSVETISLTFSGDNAPSASALVRFVAVFGGVEIAKTDFALSGNVWEGTIRFTTDMLKGALIGRDNIVASGAFIVVDGDEVIQWQFPLQIGIGSFEKPNGAQDYAEQASEYAESASEYAMRAGDYAEQASEYAWQAGQGGGESLWYYDECAGYVNLSPSGCAIKINCRLSTFNAPVIRATMVKNSQGCGLRADFRGDPRQGGFYVDAHGETKFCGEVRFGGSVCYDGVYRNGLSIQNGILKSYAPACREHPYFCSLDVHDFWVRGQGSEQGSATIDGTLAVFGSLYLNGEPISAGGGGCLSGDININKCSDYYNVQISAQHNKYRFGYKCNGDCYTTEYYFEMVNRTGGVFGVNNAGFFSMYRCTGHCDTIFSLGQNETKINCNIEVGESGYTLGQLINAMRQHNFL